MSIVLNAELRTDQGKGASRRLRLVEKMPAIVYGGDKDPVNLTLEQKDVRMHQNSEHFYSSILSLNVNGKAEEVIIRDVQHHPYKVDLMHIDFQRVDKKSKMHIHVPLHFLGEEKSPGVKLQGGLVSHLLIEVEIECLPKDIPEFIEVDMSKMNSGDTIHLSELNLPKGVELLALKQGADHDTGVCSIHPPKGGAVEAETEEEAGEE